MKVRALTAFSYDHRELKPGDVFDTKTNLHAQIFVEARKVEYYGSEKEEEAINNKAINEEADGHEEIENADRQEAPRRGRPRKAGKKVGALTSRRSGLVHRYRRTDLEAEDS